MPHTWRCFTIHRMNDTTQPALPSCVINCVVYDKDGKRHHYKVAVRSDGGIINFLQFDVSRDELGKRQLMTSVIAAVFLFGLLSLVLGVWLSSRVLRPWPRLSMTTTR